MVTNRRPGDPSNQVSSDALSATRLVSKQEYWLAWASGWFSVIINSFFKLRCWRIGQPGR